MTDRAALEALLARVEAHIAEKIRLHYWNNHGARDAPDAFVDDLAASIAALLRAEIARGEAD